MQRIWEVNLRDKWEIWKPKLSLSRISVLFFTHTNESPGTVPDVLAAGFQLKSAAAKWADQRFQSPELCMYHLPSVHTKMCRVFFTFISDLQASVTITLCLGEQGIMCFYIQVQNSFATAGNCSRHTACKLCHLLALTKLRSLSLQNGTFKRAHHCPMDDDIYKCFAVSFVSKKYHKYC